MDYSQLSDFEINNLVALAIGAKVTDSYRVGDERETIYYSLGEDEFCVKRGYGSFVSQFDPCHSPADAWPIIVDNRIAIIPDTAAGEWVAFNEFTLYEGDWMFASDPAHHSNGKNPLRCAMETFLIMQDSNHA